MELFFINFIGYRCPIFHKIGNARGMDGPKLGVFVFMEKQPRDWIILTKNAGCPLIILFSLCINLPNDQYYGILSYLSSIV